MDELNHLIKQSGESDIGALLSAKENAKRRMMEDPSAANIAAFDKAKELLDKAMAARTPQPQQKASDGAKHFPRLSDVVKYLKNQGYKIGKSKLYQDARAGLITGSESVGYTIEAVLAYAHTQMLEKRTDEKEDLGKLTKQRLMSEIAKSRTQEEKMRFELGVMQGKYLLKEEVKTEMALRIAAFEAAFKHLVRTQTADWVAMANGNPAATEQIVSIIYAAIDELLNEMATIEELKLTIRKDKAYAENVAEAA